MPARGSATQRSALFARQQPGGFWNTAHIPDQPGNIWFVDSTHTAASDTAGYGRNPDRPFATIDYAVGQCTANNGDVIYVMPSHTETIGAAGAITLDVKGIFVIGLGIGDDRPVLNYTDTAGTVAVDDCDIVLRHFRVTQGVDAVVTMFDVNSDDFEMDDIEFVEAAAAQAVSFVDLDGGGANACDNFHMYNCKVVQTAAGADQVVDIAQIHDGIEIKGCYMDVDCVNACIYSASAHTDCLIQDNILHNRQTGDHAIEFSAAATGHIINNSLFGDTAGTILDPGSCFMAGNNESAAIDAPGYPTPVAITDNAANILGADNGANAFASTNVVRDADGSIIERLESIEANLVGTAGVAAYPTAAKAANAVSMAEVLRHSDDAQEQCIVKADGAVLAVADPLFTITGGPIIVTEFVGIVTTVIGGAANCQIQIVVTEPAGTVNLSTDVAISSDAAGTSYTFTAATPGVLTPTTAGALDQLPKNYWLCPIGTIQADTDAAQTGVIAWYMVYKPLSPTSVVTAAA